MAALGSSMASCHCQQAKAVGVAAGRPPRQMCTRRPVRQGLRVVNAAAVAPAALARGGPTQQHNAAAPQTLGREHAKQQPKLITREAVCALEAELDSGASIAALQRFNEALQQLPAHGWAGPLARVMVELSYNLESFNPAFTAVLLKVQQTIGQSDYVRRDLALKHLIQPLAGEYGMHNNQPQDKTHRELFSEFYADLLREPLEGALADAPATPLSEALFSQMMRDILANSSHSSSMEQASYALGYNLAIEYLADYEKRWMLDSFRELNKRVLAPQGRGLTEWLFLEVHAEGEAEHAAIGHAAVTSLVPAAHEALLRRAMLDHDRDFATFYNALADMLAI